MQEEGGRTKDTLLEAQPSAPALTHLLHASMARTVSLACLKTIICQWARGPMTGFDESKFVSKSTSPDNMGSLPVQSKEREVERLLGRQ